MQYKVVINRTNKLAPLVQVLAAATATPGGYTSLGTFEHPGLDTMGPEVNHVIYQHVQELMYKADPLDIQLQNLQFTHITWPGKVVATAVAQTNKFVEAGTETQLTAVTTPAEVSRSRVRWSTADDKIAHIDPRGKLIARAPGVTKGRVDVVDGGVYKEFDITVFADHVVPTSVTMAPGTAIVLTVAAPTAQLTATVLPANVSNKAVVWASSAPAVATVSQTGLITRVGNGAANITATTVDGGVVGTKAITATA